MDQLMVSFQHWAGSADEDNNLFLVGGKNYSWQLHEGHDGEIDGLGSKFGPRIPNESPHQGRSSGVIMMGGFRCKMILY
jgi:hypothetical protein